MNSIFIRIRLCKTFVTDVHKIEFMCRMKYGHDIFIGICNASPE